MGHIMEYNEQTREVAMKSREVIREVLDEFEDTQINMASEMARELLAHKIYKKLSEHYHMTGKIHTFESKMEEMRKYPHQDNHMD
jgi:hypothetical protein